MRALATLLHGIVDYAGLYPPAHLDMPSAVLAYASYREGRARWMLGRFVLPSARLDEFEQAAATILPASSPEDPWLLAATGSADEAADLALIRAFNRRQRASLIPPFAIDTYETRVADAFDIARIAPLAGGGLRVAYEIPLGPGHVPLFDAVRRAGGVAKIRTGGLTPDAIPPVERVAEFIWHCARAGVPMKATAGLHHPVRSTQRLTYAADSPVAVVHGFLNVFVASALAVSLAATEDEDAAMRIITGALAEQAPSRFAFDDESVGWRDYRVTRGEVRASRTSFALGFGSCSFDEPVTELRGLGFHA